jgi:hypothetical protein
MKKKIIIRLLIWIVLVGGTGIAAAADKPAQDNGRFRIFSIFGNRYDEHSESGVTDTSSVFDINTFFDINAYFTVITRSEFHQWWRDEVDRSALPPALADAYDENWQSIAYQAFAEGRYKFLGAKLGRFTYKPAYGLVHGDYQQVSGGEISAGYNDRVKVALAGGRNTHYMGPFGPQDNTEYIAGDIVLSLIPKTNIKAAYMENDDVEYLEAGFDIMAPFDVGLEAAYIQSDAADDEIGYHAQVKYKNAIPFAPNTYDLYIQYHYLEADSIMGNDIPLESDIEGIRLGLHYAPFAGVLLWTFYDFAESITTGEEDNFFRVQLDFFFDMKM